MGHVLGMFLNVWTMYEMCVEYVWNMLGISVEYVWNMYGICV